MSLRSIAERMDPVAPATSLKQLCAQHFSETPVTSLAEMEKRHSHPDRLMQRFFVFNTFLMDIPGEGRKPAVEYRDAEIGRYVSSRAYDVICLSEVWHREERLDLLNSLDFDPNVAHRSGGEGVNLFQIRNSAGLVTVTRDLSIIAEHFHEYDNESGSDAHAAKGCLLSVHDTGLDSAGSSSSINVYSTHLNASGDAKYAQVLELANFIWQTKDKERGDRSQPDQSGLNASILAGDFNLDRFSTNTVDTTYYATLARRMRLPDELVRAITNRTDEGGHVTADGVRRKSGFDLLSDMLGVLGFKDLWKLRNGSAGYSVNLTNQGVVDVIAGPAGDDPMLCEDAVEDVALRALTSRPEAIDHVFVTPTTDRMSFTIDYTRPRRPRTAREPGSPQYGDGGLTFLSDHLGLETTILAAPKS